MNHTSVRLRTSCTALVGDHRQRQRDDRAHVDMGATGRIDTPCRQTRAECHWRSAARNAATGGAMKFRRRR